MAKAWALDAEADIVCDGAQHYFLSHVSMPAAPPELRQMARHGLLQPATDTVVAVEKLDADRGSGLVTQIHLPPGTTVMRASGLGVVVRHSHTSRTCDACGVNLVGHKTAVTCVDCAVAKFCTKECERRGRDSHGLVCEASATLAQAVPQLPFPLDHDLARLALRLFTDRAVFDSEEARSLVSHRHLVDDETWRAACAGGAVLKRLLETQTPSQVVAASDEEAGELLLRLRFNAHPLDSIPFSPEDRDCGRQVPTLRGALLGLFPRGAKANHSCSPNAVLSFQPDLRSTATRPLDGVVLQIRSTAFCLPGDEVTYSYLEQLCLDRPARQDLLRKGFLFTCHCPRCAAPPQPAGTKTAKAEAISKADRATVLTAMQWLSQRKQGTSTHRQQQALEATHLSALLRIANGAFESPPVVAPPAEPGHPRTRAVLRSGNRSSDVPAHVFDAASCAVAAAQAANDTDALAAAAAAVAACLEASGAVLSPQRADMLWQQAVAQGLQGPPGVSVALEALSVLCLCLGPDHPTTRSRKEAFLRTCG